MTRSDRCGRGSWYVAVRLAVAVGLIALGLLARPAAAQDLTGTWQGTLSAAKDMRMVLKVSKRAGGGWEGILYSLDSYMPSQGMASTMMSLRGATFAFAIAPADERYEGQLSGDASQIEGTLTQGKDAHALNLVRVNAETAWAIPAPKQSMPADADPTLEVATIKPTDPKTTNDMISIQGRHFLVVNKTVEFLVTAAYGLQASQVVGAPGWFSSEKYDIDGTPDVEGQPNLMQMRSILRKLLADRFQLVAHHDKKEMNVYAISVAKAGPKIAKSLGDPNGLPFQNGGRDANGRVDRYANVTMKDFAFILQFMLDKPVVDQTGLQGRFDFVLKWTPNDTNVADPATASPAIFTAFQEQLGLKLEAVRAPADVLVVDKLERPSAN
jgi:uncharacterized protein (TIGR03435 family)